jgi:hypothetical protein
VSSARAAALLAALLVSLAVGCANSAKTVEVETDHDGSFDFSAVNTWDWTPGKQPDIPDPRVMDSVVDARMRRAITDELAARGLARLEGAVPDVLVQYRIWVMPRSDFNPVRGDRVRGEVLAADETNQGRLDDVGLRIEMFHPLEPERRVWRAESRTKLDLRATEMARRERTTAAVRKLLSRFPPE